MEKKYFMYLLFITSVLMLGSCSSTDTDDQDKEIETSAFILKEAYRWNLSKQKEAFYVINSLTDMQKHIEPVDETANDVYAPDFEKYTLLLTSGVTYMGYIK